MPGQPQGNLWTEHPSQLTGQHHGEQLGEGDPGCRGSPGVKGAGEQPSQGAGLRAGLPPRVTSLSALTLGPSEGSEA